MPKLSTKIGGCFSSDKKDCHFVKCCLNREIENFGFCLELSEFCPDDRPECPQGYRLENLRIRRVIRTEAWLKLQQKK
ncbi:hypothetical protein KEJ45_04340 [Candidatus Bathyarchaeota archaeon]|nr:hypothetical protein [Candidatus Bathyarchaeota archaeon]